VREALAASALARQKNEDVHDDLVRVASQSRDGILRQIAVSALEKVATEGDRDLLERLEQSDPYRRPAVGRHANQQEWRYPVRDAAREALEELDR